MFRNALWSSSLSAASYSMTPPDSSYRSPSGSRATPRRPRHLRPVQPQIGGCASSVTAVSPALPSNGFYHYATSSRLGLPSFSSFSRSGKTGMRPRAYSVLDDKICVRSGSFLSIRSFGGHRHVSHFTITVLFPFPLQPRLRGCRFSHP